ncbi:unnamed protein product [Closterium sp. Yama58-4]|nr:unnamed protein product [Closterium sp. Yama58-4]
MLHPRGLRRCSHLGGSPVGLSPFPRAFAILTASVKNLVLLLLLLICAPNGTTVVTARRIQASDFSVLEQLLESWGGFADGKSWSPNSDCSTVQGITCDSNGYVLSLSTAGNDLHSFIPDEISGLQHLTFLSITSSRLIGYLPSGLFNLPLLKSLCVLTGCLPRGWGLEHCMYVGSGRDQGFSAVVE